VDIASPAKTIHLKDSGDYEDKRVVYSKNVLLKVWTGKELVITNFKGEN